MTSEPTDDELIGRIEGIKQHMQLLEELGFEFLTLPNVFEVDPLAEEPFILSNSFIPEQIGGSVRVIERGDEEDGSIQEPLEVENLNHMLRSFLPGGFQKRWKAFDLWQGDWDFNLDNPGSADISPMFEFKKKYPLSEILGDDTDEYTLIDHDVDDVTVYIPQSMYVKRLSRDTQYYWSVDYQTIFAAKSPFGRYLPLGRSDPTTNYLWFRHLKSDISAPQEPLPDGNELLVSHAFEDEVEFIRCYYTSLLTLYEKKNNDTLSRTIDYVNTEDEKRAFVASNERSQLLLFNIDRQTVRQRVTAVLGEHPALRRDLQFSLAHRLVWDRLFFEKGALENVFQVEPFINHLIGVDFRCRTTDLAESVFDAKIETVIEQLRALLKPGKGLEQGPLCLMGYDPAPQSAIIDVVDSHDEIVRGILSECADEETLLDFAEEVFVHSVEHGLATWATDETSAGGSFELWYDTNFQGRSDDHARLGIYDSIQGGAGIADEVHDHINDSPNINLDTGVGKQAACHTAAADQTVLEVLTEASGDVLYDLFHESSRAEFDEDTDEGEDDEPTGFQAQITAIRDQVIDDEAMYNLNDLTSHIENRIQALFETRETARFYAYVAAEYAVVEDQLERTPRAVDILLHLDQHIFRDPRVRETYRRFAEDEKGRDLSELGERLEELTHQCITACPDCIEAEEPNCVHGMKYQAQLLNRRLLKEVSSYAA